jgi:hypothetical protein
MERVGAEDVVEEEDGIAVTIDTKVVVMMGIVEARGKVCTAVNHPCS